jgi:hypothetical protein
MDSRMDRNAGRRGRDKKAQQPKPLAQTNPPAEPRQRDGIRREALGCDSSTVRRRRRWTRQPRPSALAEPQGRRASRPTTARNAPPCTGKQDSSANREAPCLNRASGDDPSTPGGQPASMPPIRCNPHGQPPQSKRVRGANNGNTHDATCPAAIPERRIRPSSQRSATVIESSNET